MASSEHGERRERRRQAGILPTPQLSEQMAAARVGS